jgi:hypothetical protein
VLTRGRHSYASAARRVRAYAFDVVAWAAREAVEMAAVALPVPAIDGERSHRPQSHLCTALLSCYVSSVVSYRKYTRVRDNAFTAHG